MAPIRYIVASTYRHEGLGVVHIKTHATSQRLTARWRGVELYVTVPKRCTVEAYEQFISNNIDRLLELRPKTTIQQSRFIDGNFADFTIKVGTLPHHKDL
ncbi:MAG: hypothetical protein K2M55_02000, partial [Muribaculaceae bacterium]|nr:hypothetical protein [Muribaculaceae bacterium]